MAKGNHGDSSITEINGLVQLWAMHNELKVAFVPHDTGKGKLGPEWAYVYEYQGRAVGEDGMARIVCSYMYDAGYRFTKDQCLTALMRWTWDRYLEQVDPNAYLPTSVPRVVMKRRPGRPRKDGTSHTVYVKPMEAPAPGTDTGAAAATATTGAAAATATTGAAAAIAASR